MHGEPSSLSPWPSRLDAVLAGFAMYAAEHESAVSDIAQSFMGGGEE